MNYRGKNPLKNECIMKSHEFLIPIVTINVLKFINHCHPPVFKKKKSFNNDTNMSNHLN